MNLSGNSVSRVWREGNSIFKKQPKYLCDNEWYALSLFRHSGMVPAAFRIDNETIRMEFLVSEPITDTILFEDQCYVFLRLLKDKIRHGDLTVPHVFVRNNAPVVIDWAESRLWNDPRPDKRREGDKYWLDATVSELILQRQST